MMKYSVGLLEVKVLVGEVCEVGKLVVDLEQAL